MVEPAAIEESALVFSCQGSKLIGILHHPVNPEKIALVIIVGGPQTRVGSHRQFVQLARMLAKNGITVLRFDYRGMGDSGGSRRNFWQIDDDIRAAVDILQARSRIDRVVLWGLCDAVPAITSYASTDERICGIVLLNPWVRTDIGIARAYMRMHYFKRMFSREFWIKLARGELNVFESASAFIDTAWRALYSRETMTIQSGNDNKQMIPLLPDSMIDDVSRFDGSILLVMSGNDLTAQEFHSTVEVSPFWRKLRNRSSVVRRELADADHTFSRRVWSRQVEEWTLEWMKAL